MPKGVYGHKIPGYWAGKKRPDISIANKGKVFSEITIEKMRHSKLLKPTMYWLGRKRPEVAKWISMANKGRTSPHKGKKFPDRSGENNHRWINDRTKLKDDHRDRGGQLHREWSRSVKARDGWVCKIANGDCSGRLETHHILGWSKYPELRYIINNGITLCHAHHPKKRAEEKRLEPVFKALVSVSK